MDMICYSQCVQIHCILFIRLNLVLQARPFLFHSTDRFHYQHAEKTQLALQNRKRDLMLGHAQKVAWELKDELWLAMSDIMSITITSWLKVGQNVSRSAGILATILYKAK